MKPWAVVLALLAAVPARAWDPATHERIAAHAAHLMPAALGEQLGRNRAALLEGLAEPDRVSPAETHALHADGSGGTLDRDAAERAARAVAVLRAQGSFADFARELGALSHYVADAAFPLNTSASDPREREFYADYAAYAGSKLGKYPAIFGGFERLDTGFDVASYVRAAAETANRRYPLVARAYFPDGSPRMRSSRSFDDRGPAFGVTQLSFVQAVTATANVWLWVWHEAHGSLAGTPHYPVPARSNGAQGRAGAAQRP